MNFRNPLIATLFCLLLAIAPSALAAEEDSAIPTGSRSGMINAGEGQSTAAGEFDDPFADETEMVVSDPIEPFNRAMFWVNDKLYFYLFKPLARGYRYVPEPARVSVGNFFSNLGTPVRFLNNTLQLKLERAGTELGRFAVNSTVGVLGLFDPAKNWLNWDKAPEDFGQTLGHYGIGSGIYIVWPLFGPSDARDTVGLVGDYLTDPITSPYYFKLKQWEVTALKSFDRINYLSLDKDSYEKVLQEALDPYLFIRNAYLQSREARIKH